MKIKGIEKDLCFVCDENEFSGVQKISLKVAKDIERVFGFMPTKSYSLSDVKKNAVVFGTVGKSALIDNLEKEGNMCSNRFHQHEVQIFLVHINTQFFFQFTAGRM